jgi:DNA-binding beta-propeller fold protein YncE
MGEVREDRMRAIHWVALVLISAVLTGRALATPIMTYNYGMTDFVEASDNSAIYAAVPSQNSVAIIDPNTLQATLVGVGSNPTSVALSLDGTKLYVSTQGSNFIAVVNTQSHALLSPIPLGPGVNPLDVQVGTNNRLWVLTGAQNQFDSIIQVNATTGASTGAGPSVFTYGGRIRATSDGQTLYYGNFGVSPSGEYKIDVSGTAPSVVWSTSLGGNGLDVALTHDGSWVAFPEGGNSQNGIIQTSSQLTLGSVGPASSLAFSPDNAFGYTGIFFAQGIGVYNLTTFLQTGSIDTVGGPQGLFVDNSGRYLFSYEGNTQVYATGRVAPEPASALMIAGALFAISLARPRRRGTNI